MVAGARDCVDLLSSAFLNEPSGARLLRRSAAHSADMLFLSDAEWPAGRRTSTQREGDVTDLFTPALELREVAGEVATRAPALLTASGIAVFFAKPSRWSKDWRSKVEALLSTAENERAMRFRDAADRATWKAAHGLTRLTLTACEAAVDPRSWIFLAGPNGKPEIARPKCRLHFNLSHTRDFAGCAVTKAGSIGFDVEDVSRSIDPAVAEQNFRREEIEFLGRPNDASWQDRFYEVWTLKESYLKARGSGLLVPLTGFAFVKDHRGQWRVRERGTESGQGCRWRFFSFWIAPGYRAAVSFLVEPA
jgi:4'-phosphopantetheinyl transferase